MGKYSIQNWYNLYFTTLTHKICIKENDREGTWHIETVACVMRPWVYKDFVCVYVYISLYIFEQYNQRELCNIWCDKSDTRIFSLYDYVTLMMMIVIVCLYLFSRISVWQYLYEMALTVMVVVLVLVGGLNAWVECMCVC